VSVVDDETTRQRIRDIYERTGYLLDPHGAVAYEAAARFAQDKAFEGPIVALATAHPAKFGSAIANVVGFTPELPGDAFRDWMSRPIAAIDLDDTSYGAFEQVLRDLPDVGELSAADPAML
jgi:threonine synthase